MASAVCKQMAEIRDLLTDLQPLSCPVAPPADVPQVSMITLHRGGTRDWLHIAEIVAQDDQGQQVPLLAVGMEPTPPKNHPYPASNAVNGDLKDFAHSVTGTGSERMMFVPKSGSAYIQKILVYNRSEPELRARLIGARVDVVGPGILTRSYPIASTKEFPRGASQYEILLTTGTVTPRNV